MLAKILVSFPENKKTRASKAQIPIIKPRN